MTRTVADSALMMQAMSGEDVSDPWSIGFPQGNLVEASAPSGDLRGPRIAFCLAPLGRPVAADVVAAFKVALARLEALGAEIEEILGDGFEVEPIWRAINHTAWRARFEKLAADHSDVLSETFMKQLALATKVSGVDYQRAMFDRTALFRRGQTFLQKGDNLPTPTTPPTAPPN